VLDSAIKIFDLNTLTLLSTVVTQLLHYAGMPINTLALTPDGKYAVTASDDGKIGVFNVALNKFVAQMPCPCQCPAVVVQDPWSRCKEEPCTDGCGPMEKKPVGVVSSFALFNNPMSVTDPDSMDYGFDSKPFAFEARCLHCKMYMTESLLVAERRCTNDLSLCKINRDCLSDDGNNGLCKSDNPRITPCNDASCQIPLVSLPPKQGIHAIPNPKMGSGNRHFAIRGTMRMINLALTGLTYLGDSNFNTRYGLKETIFFYVNDMGAIGDNYAISSLSPLSGNALPNSVSLIPSPCDIFSVA